jgi:hypothetical protein
LVDLRNLREIAASLPDVTDESAGDRLAFSCGGKSIAWTYLRRVSPRKARVAMPDVLAIRCPVERKEMLIDAAPEIFFDDDHYRGYPAVLVRLEVIGAQELRQMLENAARETRTAGRRR